MPLHPNNKHARPPVSPDAPLPLNGISKTLVTWFQATQRDLPWRRDYSPYAVWISEIMLQQTTVKTVLPYYVRWMERFPHVAAVAEAPTDDLHKAWEGLGYYARVRHIQATARLLVRDLGGVFPKVQKELLKLPGIGLYTAGAILSLAFNEPVPAVDGNVERVVSRLFDISVPVKKKAGRDLIHTTVRELIPPGQARLFNQGLMELGALICLPKTPDCPRCPVRDCCLSRRAGTISERPLPVARRKPVPLQVAVGVLVHEGKILIQKRPPAGLMANLWEFPGGKVEPGETPEEALVREFMEELGVAVKNLQKITVIRHSYTTFRVVLHAFRCRLEELDQQIVPRVAVEARWATREELDHFAFPAANRKLITRL